MATGVKRDKARFTDSLVDYLQLVDYRQANSSAEYENIYRFRYQSYLREKAIDKKIDQRFFDDYDKLDNCWTFGIDYQEQLVSSLRIHLLSEDSPRSPTLDVFPDIVGPLVECGYKIIDPTRFVSDSSTTNFSPVLPFLTFRLVCMAADYLEADYCLIPVSAVHSAFYQRMFGLSVVGEPRNYPSLKTPICLMRANVAKLWDGMFEKYPVFRSTFTERRMLFDKPTVPTGIVESTRDGLVEINPDTDNSKVSKLQLN